MQLIKTPYPTPPIPAITAEAEDQRNELVMSARTVTAVTTAEQNQLARNIAVELRQYLKAVEATRTELTAPLLHGQRLLKSLADDHVAPLQAELRRLERLATTFLEAEQKRVAAEMKARLDLAAEARTDEDFNTISNEPLPAVAKASGQTMRQELCWEVTDILALVKARPDLCRIEPKAAAIKSCCVPEVPIPGLKLWWENRSLYTSR